MGQHLDKIPCAVLLEKASWRSKHKSRLPPLLQMLYVDWVSADLNLTSRVFSEHSGFLPPQNRLLVYSIWLSPSVSLAIWEYKFQVPRKIVRLIQAFVLEKQSGTHFAFFNDIETLSLWRRTITCTHPCAKTLCEFRQVENVISEVKQRLIFLRRIKRSSPYNACLFSFK